MDRKIILFGSGVYGLKVLNALGKDNVFAFCDNECNICGEKYGKTYITLDYLKQIFDKYILLLSMNPINSREVADQLREIGIDDFVIVNEKIITQIENNPLKFISEINDDCFRLSLEKKQCIDMLKDLQLQFDLLKRLSDIRKLKKAQGYLSYVQEDTIRIAKKIFEDIKKLRIKPFLIAGSLLGYYRHGGFIPWDDDLDFGLLRNDYMRLLNYGKENYIYIEVKASFDYIDDEMIRNALLNNPRQFLMIVSPSCMQIASGNSEVDLRKIDFFAYDFIKDGISFNKYKNIIDRYSEKRYTERGNRVFLQIIENESITEKYSNTVYWGLDNMDSYIYKREDWISADTIVPLQKVCYEGLQCYVPNKTEAMLKIFYEDYLSYPRDLTCKHLQESIAIRLKKNNFYTGIIISDVSEVALSKSLYYLLRKNNIYCIYCIDKNFLHNERAMKDVEDEIITNKLEYINFLDPYFSIVISNIEIPSVMDIVNLQKILSLEPNEIIKDIKDRGK